MATLLLSCSDIVGMPVEGSKLLRVWWEFEGNTDTFEDFDISDEVLPGDNGLFDWDGILEHSYDVRTSMDSGFASSSSSSGRRAIARASAT